MNRIHNFSSFTSLYEAEEVKEKPYLTLLKQILSYINTSYMSQLKLTEDPYDAKIIGDLDSVASAPGPDSYKKILANVKSAVDASDPAAKAAGEAWSAAGEKFVSALGKMIEKLKDNKESLDAANKSIADFIATQKQNLQKASQDNDLKKEVEAGEKKNEGLSYEDLNENIFTGKKGMIKNIAKEVTVVSSILRDMSAIPGMEAEAKKYQDEVAKISADMGSLLDKKNSEIDKEELKKAADRLAEIPTLLAKKSEEIAKEDTANKEAAAIFVDALKSLEAAKTADQAYVEKSEASAKEEKAWNDSAKSTIGFKGTVKMEDTKGKKSTVVAGFQKQVIDKFKSILKDSDAFKKFSEGKFAGDGFFGPNTAKVVQGIKAGFGMDDKTSDITDEFLNKVYTYAAAQKQNESQSFGRIQTFSSFETINEAKLKFDVNKFLTAVGEKGKEEEKKKDLPTPEDLLKSMNKTVEDVYSNNKDGIDYILGKDFEPTEEGRKNFFNIFRIGWDNFSKLNDNQKKNTLAMGFKATLAPATGVEKNIGKDLIDVYLKAKKKD
jgi:GTP cyclohydrolase I